MEMSYLFDAYLIHVMHLLIASQWEGFHGQHLDSSKSCHETSGK